MTTTLVDLTLLANAEQKTTTDITAVASTRASGRGTSPRIPLCVPREQLYYWTTEWQTGEAEALRDIEAGRMRRFDSGADAADWLLSDED
jgi:hypothetical protein